MVPGTRVPGTVPGTVVEAVGPYLVVGNLNRSYIPGTRYKVPPVCAVYTVPTPPHSYAKVGRRAYCTP